MPISISYYLDDRTAKSSLKEGQCKEYPIKLAICKNGATAFISSGIKVKSTQWKERRVVNRPDKTTLNDFLDSFKARVKGILYDGRDDGRYFNMRVTDIKNDILIKLNGGKRNGDSNSFLSYFEDFASKRNSDRTKEIYCVTANKIRSLFPYAEKLTLEAITLDWLENFDTQLIARGNNSSTRNLDFRNIRAVVKYAHKHKMIKYNPFDDFKIPLGESPDRALTISQLRTFRNVKVKCWEKKYVDFFFLSFYLIGINTEDLLHVKRIEDGRINYIRSKTQKALSIKVEPEALSIINKYRGERYLLNILDTYSRTHNWTAKVDSVLKNIAIRNNLPPITMYWARHTWATLAHADLGIDIGTISDAFGHQPENKVTLVYIRKRDYSKVDLANRKVIDYCTSESSTVLDEDSCF